MTRRLALVTYMTFSFLAIAVTTLGTLVFYPYAPDKAIQDLARVETETSMIASRGLHLIDS